MITVAINSLGRNLIINADFVLTLKLKCHLTHWDRVTHICVGNLTIIGYLDSNNKRQLNFNRISYIFKHFVSVSMCCISVVRTLTTLSLWLHIIAPLNNLITLVELTRWYRVTEGVTQQCLLATIFLILHSWTRSCLVDLSFKTEFPKCGPTYRRQALGYISHWWCAFFGCLMPSFGFLTNIRLDNVIPPVDLWFGLDGEFEIYIDHSSITCWCVFNGLPVY